MTSIHSTLGTRSNEPEVIYSQARREGVGENESPGMIIVTVVLAMVIVAVVVIMIPVAWMIPFEGDPRVLAGMQSADRQRGRA